MNFAYARSEPNVLPAAYVLFYTDQTHVTVRVEVDTHLGEHEAYLEMRTPRGSAYGFVTSYIENCLVVHITHEGHVARSAQQEMQGVMGETYAPITPSNAHFVPVAGQNILRHGGHGFALVLHVGPTSTIQYALSA